MPNPTGINQYTGNVSASDRENAASKVPGGKTLAQDVSDRANENSTLGGGPRTAEGHNTAAAMHDQAARYQHAIGNHVAGVAHQGKADQHAMIRDNLRRTEHERGLAAHAEHFSQAKASADHANRLGTPPVPNNNGAPGQPENMSPAAARAINKRNSDR